MAVIYKTPGVYIEEIPVFPQAIAPADTAIPAFIGYTDTDDKMLKAQKIASQLEFEEYYCTRNEWKLTFNVTDNTIEENFSGNELYYHMKLYFANGGGKCYVISLGKKPKDPGGRKDDYLNALAVLADEDGPTLIVMPEATGLTFQDCMEVYKEALAQAAKRMNRFVIMDVPKGDDAVKAFRNGVGNNHLAYGAAYYPYLQTTIGKYDLLADDDITFKNAANEGKNGNVKQDQEDMDRKNLIKYIKSLKQVLPPSAAIAGVYAHIDATRGVWKAPANVSLHAVSGLERTISQKEQEGLNIDPVSGKSINAIRAFTGKGILVWGARTLAGNDNEWRYISVRRFYSFVEESVRNATRQFVFEANDANTWARTGAMVENFLTNLWRQGALAGVTPSNAFFVKAGLGSTMTSDDIMNGIMNVEIGLAVTRPAEFVILKFSQKIQENK